MIKEKVTIDFKMNIPSTDLNINLSAQAELHHSQPYWVLRTVRIISQTGIESGMPVFKNISIRKIEQNGEVHWVHCDTNLESPLSTGAGEAIDALGK